MTQQKDAHQGSQWELNNDEDLEFHHQEHPLDDAPSLVLIEGQMHQMMEAMTRIGGEVCRLRAEVDELLDQNHVLLRAFEQLKTVIEEKGTLNLDEFELACDVVGSIQERPQAGQQKSVAKRLSN